MKHLVYNPLPISFLLGIGNLHLNRKEFIRSQIIIRYHLGGKIHGAEKDRCDKDVIRKTSGYSYSLIKPKD